MMKTFHQDRHDISKTSWTGMQYVYVKHLASAASAVACLHKKKEKNIWHLAKFMNILLESEFCLSKNV